MTSRLSLPVEQWPDLDREMWEAATAPSHARRWRRRPAAGWSPSRRRIVIQAYGQWLSWLQREGLLEPTETPGRRATPKRVEAFVEELQKRVAPASVGMMLGGLRGALGVLAPEMDWSWLVRAYVTLKNEARPSRDRRKHLVAPDQLYQLGLQLMKMCHVDVLDNRDDYACIKYRDGLLIALAICHPVRIHNLARIELDRHLFNDGGAYILTFTPEETKTGAAYEAELPDELVPWLERYLDVYRPRLLARGQEPTDRLWLNRWGRPAGENALRSQINLRTTEAFGEHVWPHLFRTCAATGIVNQRPQDIAWAPEILGHADLRTTERHYVLADRRLAQRRVQENLARRRAEARARLKKTIRLTIQRKKS